MNGNGSSFQRGRGRRNGWQTCAPPLLNTVATISEEEPTGITGSNIVEISSNTTKNCSKTDPLLVSGGAS
jgi:hypothetical protein